MDVSTFGSGADVQYNVRVGTWTNWSRGSVFGATLTLSRGNGNLLIAFTAFFIGFISTRFWRLACLTFHRWYSTPNPQDALHHQRQAVLRNSAAAESGLWVLGQISWAWRRSARRAFVRTLPLLVLALVCTLAFTAASGFSSSVSTAIGNEVLVDGTNCGFVQSVTMTELSSKEVADAFGFEARLTNNAANYAQQCYSSNSAGSNVFSCNSFVVDRLPTVTINTEAPCPFKNGLCRTNTSNILLDSGYIDSHAHLGLDAPENERILWRQVLQCAPLRTEGRTSDTAGLHENYTRYHYGSAINGTAEEKKLLNYTYEVSDLQSQYDGQNDNFQRNLVTHYYVSILQALFVNGSLDDSQSDFMPDPDLNRPDSDLFLIFLSGNGIMFMDQTEDDWYRATVPGRVMYAAGSTSTRPTYKPEDAASPLACIAQYQLCNAALSPESRCGPLTNYWDAQEAAAPLFNLTSDTPTNNTSDPTYEVSNRLLWFMNILNLNTISLRLLVNSLGASSLVSQQSNVNGFQGLLPRDQWKIDVTHWWSTLLASVQIGFVSTATGVLDPAFADYHLLPDNSVQKHLCGSQMIKSTDFTSFSLFGLYFVFITGGLIILFSYTLEPLLGYIHRRNKAKHFKHLEWTANETIHLQRLAFEGRGRGMWSRHGDAIPVTRPAQVLEHLALTSTDDEEKYAESALSPTDTKMARYTTSDTIEVLQSGTKPVTDPADKPRTKSETNP